MCLVYATSAILRLALRTLSTVLTTALLTAVNTRKVKRTADDVVTYTRKVFYLTTTNKNYTVLLKVVALTTDVRSDFDTVG